ncbi:MAG: beta-propeller fold lactonase family protein [Flavobacterium sp.]|nr:beta-propeller fold lactonase family protein [Flavobacterium sp.]
MGKLDGSITPAKQVIQHKGKSINTQRQESSHAHVQFTPDKQYVLANDLRIDCGAMFVQIPPQCCR